jgi:hypothetical protein
LTNAKIKPGHNIALVSLVDWTPYQPLTQGLQYLRTSYTASGLVIIEEPFIEYMFPILTETQYIAMLTLGGLTAGAQAADVTIYAQDEDFAWQRFNGTAIRPEALKRRGFHLYDVPLLVRTLRDTV